MFEMGDQIVARESGEQCCWDQSAEFQTAGPEVIKRTADK